MPCQETEVRGRTGNLRMRMRSDTRWEEEEEEVRLDGSVNVNPASCDSDSDNSKTRSRMISTRRGFMVMIIHQQMGSTVTNCKTRRPRWIYKLFWILEPSFSRKQREIVKNGSGCDVPVCLT